jgi:hypothetical protein
MASTYSDLKIELIGTGEQTGTWGTTTNNNFSIALSEAITGSADVAFSSADVTVTLTDTNASQTARNLRLNLTGTSGGARQLILGSGCQIEKLYLINNGLADAVTVKNTSGTGIAVAAGKSMFVYNNGTNVVDATTYLSSLTLGTALPVASGGTGSTSTTFVNLTSNVTGTLPVANGGTGATTLTGVLKGNGTSALSAATAGTEYVAPATTTNFTAQQYFGNVALTDGATIAWAANTAQVATFTFVSNNRTMGAPTGLVNGAYYGLAVIQNAGSNTLTWNAVFKWAGGTAPTLSTGASAKDYFVFRSDGTNLYEQGRSLGVA